MNDQRFHRYDVADRAFRSREIMRLAEKHDLDVPLSTRLARDYEKGKAGPRGAIYGAVTGTALGGLGGYLGGHALRSGVNAMLATSGMRPPPSMVAGVHSAVRGTLGKAGAALGLLGGAAAGALWARGRVERKYDERQSSVRNARRLVGKLKAEKLRQKLGVGGTPLTHPDTHAPFGELRKRAAAQYYAGGS